MSKFIEVKDLHVSYGDTKIIKGIDLSVKENKFVGILGPNGSGKSTLLKAIYRVNPYDSGEIFIDNKNIKDIPLKENAKLLSVVQQVDDIPFDFSVYDMVIMGRTPYKKFMERDNLEDVRITKEAIEKVGLKGYEDRSIQNLSGGERQRVVLARAFAQKSKAMILDEPTNHLDINYQLSLMRLVKSLNCTCLCALHDINMAFMFCDEVYAMKDGKIIDKGDPDEIVTKELILELYDVKSKVVRDEETNRKYVLFLDE
ncbi:MAG: ABC transporter ATP-binding protein [Tissierellia bacterium]|nr:ABC transporter ATP-binding protein [Tissierellia bacterium]